MVLGIDEYYKIPEDCNAHTNYNIYKKFTQRVINETGFEYREWIQPMDMFATVYKGNIIKNLIMDCQSYTKYRPNETTGGIFVSWRRKEELPTGA